MDNAIDEVGSTLKIIDKCIVVIVITLATIIFLPEEAALSTGIAKVRNEYFGYLWIGLIFSSLYLLFNISRSFFNKRSAEAQKLKVIATKSEQARLDKKADADLEEQKKNIVKREQTEQFKLLFSALTVDELGWIRYCLIKQQMTVNTFLGNPVAGSLVSKNLVFTGSGLKDNLPCSFYPDAWSFLTANKNQFLPETDLNSLEIKRQMNAFERSLEPFNG